MAITNLSTLNGKRETRNVFYFVLIQTYDLIIRMTDTKENLLDAAESLFGEYGYAATSLRQIITQAKANLASIHYHFGSKQELLEQVILRKVSPINEQRLKLLDTFESEAAPLPAPVEKIVEAVIMPAMLIDKDRQFVKLMGRMHSEGLMPEIARRRFQPLISRFFSAVHRARPDISMEEMVWKVHFMMGAMAHTLLIQPEAYRELAPESQVTIARRLIAFISWGFRAPAVVEKEVEVSQ
jgi:AcrR family transcriptional regulator